MQKDIIKLKEVEEDIQSEVWNAVLQEEIG